MAGIDFENFDVSKPQDFDLYVERIDCFFTAKKKTDDKKTAIFLSCVGSECYRIARNLSSPKLPSELPYEDLILLLRSYFTPKVNIVSERYKFHKRTQGEKEPVNQYMNCLRQMASTCQFGAFLEEALRDQFVCGLRNSDIIRRCLADATLTLQKAYDLASSMEGVQCELRNMNIANDTTVEISQVQARSARTRPRPDTTRHEEGKCFRCLDAHHKANVCKFKDVICHFCQKKGHIERACLKKLKSKPFTNHDLKIKTCQSGSNDSRNTMNDSDQSSDDSVCIMNVSSSYKSQPLLVKTHVQGVPVSFELDTGAEISLVNRETWELCGSFP